MPHALRDLSSPTKDGTRAPAVKALSPNHWTTREFPPLTFYICIWNWETRLFFDSVACSKLQISANPAFYRFNSIHFVYPMPFNWLHNYWKKASPHSGLGYGHLSLVKDPTCHGASPWPPPFAPSHAPPMGWCSITSKILSCKTAAKQQDDDLFSTSNGICKHCDKWGEAPKLHSLAGPLKWKHTAFQH